MLNQMFSDMYAYSRTIMHIAFLFLVVFVCLVLLNEVFVEGPKRRRYTKLLDVYDHTTELTTARVAKIIEKYMSNPTYDQKHNYKGLYVLYNTTKKKYFVGVDEHVLDAVMWQLSGKGYTDVYADVRAGDVFVVRTIPYSKLKQMGYADLQGLWSIAVMAFKATNPKKGYH